MRYDEVPAGRYKAKATRARAGESKQKKTPFIEVEFQLLDHDVNIRWTGYLTSATINRTMETMALLDWNNDETFQPGSINTGRELSLTIEREVGQDGKDRPRVKWVNDASRSKFEGLSPETLKSKFSHLNLKGHMAAARERMGIKHQAPASPTENEPPFDDGIDIPW